MSRVLATGGKSRANGSGGAKGAQRAKRGRPALGRTRVMVPMDAETLDVFRRMAEAASLPVGRCIADWCRDTSEGAQFVMQKMVEARQQPKLVMRELEAMGVGILEEVRNMSRNVPTNGAGAHK